ncbi:MAG: nucleotide sugar dehydrogenase [Planctomycetota bacterium]
MDLMTKIQQKQAIVGVIGLGYVGLPLVRGFCQAGFQVIGFDIDHGKIKKLNEGEPYILSLSQEQLRHLLAQKQFHATTAFEELVKVDAIVICVPTPLDHMKQPDLTAVKNTTLSIQKYLRLQQLIILESTTYPGTTEEEMLPRLEATGLKAGVDFYLAYSPEREDPGNKKYTLTSIPKVVGGFNAISLELACELYRKVAPQVVPVSNLKTAEACKILENIYRCVNIAMINELKILFERMKIDIWEVIDAAATKPFGFQPFYPGPGLGGHCIPIDPFYLSWKAKEYGMNVQFIELAGEINTQMPHYVVSKVFESLNHHGKTVKGSKILVLGVAYKKDVDDIRESPALELIKLLIEHGANIYYNDPLIPKIPKMRHYDISLSSTPLTEELLHSLDLVLIATDHNSYDYSWIVANSSLIIDTRNATKNVSQFRERVIKA